MPNSQNTPALAVGLMLVASAFIASATLMAKALGSDMFGPALHPLQISQGRFVFAFLGISAIFAVARPTVTRPNWRLHIGRTVFGWGGVSLMFAAVAFIPLGDATAISFLNPVIAMLLAIPMLGERVGPIRWSAAILALCGAMVLLRPTPESFRLEALLALGAACLIGMELIFIKQLTGREAPLQILFLNNALGVCVASIAAAPFWRAPTPQQWAALVALGLLMACAQAAFVNAMSRAEASFVAPISYTTLVFAAGLDFIVFGMRPDAISVIGAAIILAGAGLMAWREAIRTSADTRSQASNGPRQSRSRR